MAALLSKPALTIATTSRVLRNAYAVPSLLSTRRSVQVKSAYSDGAATAVSVTTTPPAPVEATTMPNSNKDDVKGPMLEPSVVNTSWVRSLAMVAAVAAAAGSTAILPARINAFLHIASYGVFLGTIIWNTFFVGLIMFKVVPRQTFGRIQSHLFPKYFALTSICNVLLLASLLLGSKAAWVPQAAITLGISLVASLGNAFILEPKATKVMFQRYALENKSDKTEEDKSQIAKLYKEFGKFHGISSLLNLIVTCAALAHGYTLAGALTL